MSGGGRRFEICVAPPRKRSGMEIGMKKFLDMISEEIRDAFEAAGYERELGKVNLYKRPDLCEYK